MNEQENKDLELAKTWFVLAEICGVVAGLVIIAAGYFYSTPTELLNLADTSLNLCKNIVSSNISYAKNETLDSCMEKFEGFFTETTEGNKVSVFLLFFGFILIVNSVLLWVIGRKKISDSNFSEMEYIWGIVIADSILIALVIIILSITPP